MTRERLDRALADWSPVDGLRRQCTFDFLPDPGFAHRSNELVIPSGFGFPSVDQFMAFPILNQVNRDPSHFHLTQLLLQSAFRGTAPASSQRSEPVLRRPEDFSHPSRRPLSIMHAGHLFAVRLRHFGDVSSTVIENVFLADSSYLRPCK